MQVLADLASKEASGETLRERYRLMQTGEVQRLLDEGALERLARDVPLTAPGLRALLQSAQTLLEAGRFRSAIAHLEEAAAHPDLDAERAAHCYFMLGLASHYLSGPSQSIASSRDRTRAEHAQAELERSARMPRRRAPSSRGCSRPAAARSSRGGSHRSTRPSRPTSPSSWDRPSGRASSTSHCSGGGSHRVGRRPAGAHLRLRRKRRQGDLTTVAATVVGPTVFINEGHTVQALDRFTGRNVWAKPFLDRARSAVTDRENYQPGDLSVVTVEGDYL